MSSERFQVLGQTLTFKTDDEKEWWQSMANTLARAMQGLGYDEEALYNQLQFFYECILPYLGVFPRPENNNTRWLSTLCPHGTAIEPSLNLSQNIARYSFEPVGPRAGTDDDPQNTHVLWECLERIQRFDNRVDLTWFRHFASRLMLNKEEGDRFASMPKASLRPGQGQYGLAMDLKGPRPMMKGYIFPGLKSKMSGISPSQLVFSAIREVDTEDLIEQPLAMLEDYIVNGPPTLRVIFMGFDMLEPRDSRIKIYTVDQDVSWDRVQDLWTMGGRLKSQSIQEGLKVLRELWDLLQIPTGIRTNEIEHCPLGKRVNYLFPTIMNWTMLPGHEDPMPQIYLVTFGMEDSHISAALATFFERLGWTQLAQDYSKNLASYL